MDKGAVSDRAVSQQPSVGSPYVVALQLAGESVLVVGGGVVATRKIEGLLGAGANVTVIAPVVSAPVRERIAERRVRWIAREWQPHDIERTAVLIYAATNNRLVNRAIVTAARRLGKLVNGADREAGRNFSTPAVARVSGATVAVVSDDGDPNVAKRLRDEVSGRLGTVAAGPGDDSPGSVSVGVPGAVTLVGGGTGDAELLTVGGRRAIEEADVVLYDNLINRQLLALARPGAELIHVGKLPFGAQTHQDTINSWLVREGSLGKRVVRLKGGDPFVFGRGTEEVEALHRAGVPFRVIPGVTSLTGVLDPAGFAITKRSRNHGFAAISAATTPPEDMRQWASVPGPVGIYMGIHKAARIAREFMAGGRPADEPVAVIANGGAPSERIATTTLAELPDLLADPKAWTPGFIVIGIEREAAFTPRPAAQADSGVITDVETATPMGADADESVAPMAGHAPRFIRQYAILRPDIEPV